MLNIRTLAATAAVSFALTAGAFAQTTPPTTPALPKTTPPPAATVPATTPPVTTAPAATTSAPAATTPPPGTATPTTTAPTGKTKKAFGARGPRTAESLACSKEANEKNIHGKPARPAFMKKCKADAAKAAKTAQ